MKLVILSVGKNHEEIYREAIGIFSDRITHYVSSFEWKYVSPSGKDGEEAKKEEGKSILSFLKEGDYAVLLDERGTLLDSLGFAAVLDKRLTAGDKRIVFIIGGAFGVSPDVFLRANLTLSLSKLVFPHQLVRLILAEQLYRAFSILKNEKYHHR